MHKVGVNFTHVDVLIDKNFLLDKYIEALCELNIKIMRIPFYWRQLFQYPNKHNKSEVVINQKIVEKYQHFFSILPKNIEFLACIINCSPHVAKEYYYDQSVFPDYYREYLNFIIKTFPFLNDIELWNEPNASDFYLSVRSRSRGTVPDAAADTPFHRPWSGAEFVRDVIVPGTAVLRQGGFTGGIVGITFAENGLVGHTPEEKVPALANTVARFIPEFSAHTKERMGAGAFYFKPDFAIEVFDALRERYPENNDIPFDYLGIHPYPYFKAGNTPFWKHSVELVEAFYNLQDRYGYSHIPVWATEVGARSVDLHNNYIQDTEAQEAFVHQFARGAGFGGERLQRMYWFKHMDQGWDLAQQKTFGLVDHYLQKKPAYYAIKSIQRNVLNRPVIGTLFDDFHFGLVHMRCAVDPDFWTIEKSEPFAYAVCARPMGQDEAHVLIYTGRSPKSWLAMMTLGALPADTEGKLTLDLDFRIFPLAQSSDASFSIEIAFKSMDAPGVMKAGALLLIEPKKAAVTARPMLGDGSLGQQTEFDGMKPASLLGVSIRTVGSNLCIFARDAQGDGSAQPLLALNDVDTKCALRVHLTFRRVEGRPGFLELKRFRAERPVEVVPESRTVR